MMHVEPTAQQATTKDAIGETPQKCSVLIVDDEDRIRHVCAKMLKQELLVQMFSAHMFKRVIMRKMFICFWIPNAIIHTI